jgi:hypothetical protein
MPVVALASQIYSAFGSKQGQSAPISSGVDSQGSTYNFGAGAPLISNGISKNNLLIIGAVVLGALFLLNR